MQKLTILFFFIFNLFGSNLKETNLELLLQRLSLRDATLKIYGGNSLVQTRCGCLFHRKCIRYMIRKNHECFCCNSELNHVKKDLKYIHPSKINVDEACPICQEFMVKNREIKTKDTFENSNKKRIKH